MAASEPGPRMQQASISEFFEKNKHFLGFDSLTRSIITAVKEAVDNSLDACEEARIPPVLDIEIRRVQGRKDELILTAQDNGPGIPYASIDKAFGRLLFGSRFHTISQTRGQQGIGITGVVLYSQLTTGKHTHIISKVAEEGMAVYVDIGIDTKRNRALKSNHRRDLWLDGNGEEIPHGVKIEARMKARYQKGGKSVHQYLRMTSIVNPHATISFRMLDEDGMVIEQASWPAVTEKLPAPVKEILPHPHGVEIGTLQRMLRDSEQSRLSSFLQKNFSRVPSARAQQICEIAEISDKASPKRLKGEQVRALQAAFKQVKLMAPPTDCLSPIEDLLIKKGLAKAIDSKFVTTITRDPCVADGNPFQVEVGLLFGTDMPSDSPIEVLRFANRVPLMYQQGGCLLTKVIESVDWRRYGLEHPGGRGIPKGPVAILIHLASTHVQFTSEAKEAVSENEVVFDELRRALLEVGRSLKSHKRKSTQRAKAREKFELINDILPEIAAKASQILGREVPELTPVITKIMKAVFIEDEFTWDADEKRTQVNLVLFNYTARQRSYTLLAKWPERDGVEIVDDSHEGRREVHGLRKWKLDTLESGESVTLSFAITGLEKDEWTETEMFFRGAGDIIGATRLDEKMLDQMRREEEAGLLQITEPEFEEAIEAFTGVAERAQEADEVGAPEELDVEDEDDEEAVRQTTLEDGWGGGE